LLRNFKTRVKRGKRDNKSRPREESLLNIERALQTPRLLQALTGVSQAEFKRVLRRFEEGVCEHQARRSYKHTPGAGRPQTLQPLREQRFFILFDRKGSPPSEVAGVLFEVERSRACRWVAEGLPLWAAALGREAVLPVRQLQSVEDFRARCPGGPELYLEGTERPSQRPQAPEAQKEAYSGKKRRPQSRLYSSLRTTNGFCGCARPWAATRMTIPC
jgi:hypothetical protein